MSFAAPGFFALLIVVALMAVMAWRLARWRMRARSVLGGPQASRWRDTFSLAATVFVLEAAVLIVIAVARPVWGTTEVTRERQGVDFVIVLDISASMQGTDVQPSRLALAQSQLTRLVEAERGNRFGLVLFAGTSILRSPLTTDAAAMTELIRRAGTETGLVRGGSDLGAALEQAGLILTASESAGKAVLVVSDGEDFGGGFGQQAQALREQDIVIYTAGVGTAQGSQLTETNRLGTTVTKVDASGRPVVTRLNEDSLRAAAAAGGGRYVRIDGNTTLLGFREDLSRLEQTPLGEETRAVPVQRFQLFAAAAFALLLVAWCVPMRLNLLRRVSLPRLGRPHPGVAMLLLVVIVGACSSGETIRSRNQAANEAYDRNSYQEALDIYHGLIAQRPDLAELSINAGNALNRAGLYDRAVQETQRALPPSNDRLGALTYYALGNHYMALEEFELAADSYRNSLVLNPSDEDAKVNLEIALLILTGQMEDPEQQGQQPGAPQGDQNGQPQQPQPGQNGEDGAQQPQDGQQPGDPGSGQQPNQSDQQPGQSGSSSDVQRQLEEALRGLNENLTYEQAQRILDLLQEQQQGQRVPGGGTTPSGPDY
ncbi:MAG: VWA domain-containing protein [Dehalococcoidia bacterium]